MHFKKEEKYNNLGYNSNQLNKLVLFESYEKRFKKKGATIINGKTYIKKKRSMMTKIKKNNTL